MRTGRWLIPLVAASGLFAADRPALLEAAKSGDQDAVRSLLQQSADANAAEADGTTALHWASYHNDAGTASALIRAGASVNAATDLGVTPLWLASENGSAPMIRLLLDAGADPNMALLSGETPLMVASRSGYPEAIEALLAKGANPDAQGARGQTALMWAAAQAHPEVVKVLLAHGADIRIRSNAWTQVMGLPPHGYLPYNKAIPHGDQTALLFAARSGDFESAKLLVAAGADVNGEDAWGVSATTLAAHSGFAEMVEFFLDNGADPNAAKAGFTALLEAVMRRDERMVAALLEHGADPNAPVRTWTPTRRSSNDWNFDQGLVGATPFWIAARFAEPRIMRLLLAHGADPLFVHRADYVAEQGFGQAPRQETVTTLMAASGLGRAGRAWVDPDPAQRETLTLEAVKMCLALGVDINAANNDGRTALDGAKSLRFDSVVKFLEENGAKSGVPEGRGRGGPRR